jgi:molybdopterin synthase sulfur carrier subunit
MKTIKLFATLRDIAGTKNLDVPFEAGQTVRDLIRAIDATCPEIGSKLVDAQGNLSQVIHIYVRGRNVEWLNGLDTVIRDEDDVLLVPPAAGG